MNAHAHSAHAAHGGHEMEDFKGTYAIWSVPFSIGLLLAFVFIVSLWVPSAVSSELKNKDVQGAEVSRAPLLKHRAEQAEALAAGSDRIAVDQAMAAVVRQRATQTP